MKCKKSLAKLSGKRRVMSYHVLHSLILLQYSETIQSGSGTDKSWQKAVPFLGLACQPWPLVYVILLLQTRTTCQKSCQTLLHSNALPMVLHWRFCSLWRVGLDTVKCMESNSNVLFFMGTSSVTRQFPQAFHRYGLCSVCLIVR